MKKKTKQMAKKKEYLNNKEFTTEIIKCKENGELSRRAVEMFQKLVDKIADGIPYRDPRDKEDCKQSALYDICKYWDRFDPGQSMNAFGFYTTVATNGLAKEFKRLWRRKKGESISFDDIFNI